MPHLQES